MRLIVVLRAKRPEGFARIFSICLSSSIPNHLAGSLTREDTTPSEGSVDMLLNPYRVLDLTQQNGLLAGQIYADLGADVIQIEPPGVPQVASSDLFTRARRRRKTR